VVSGRLGKQQGSEKEQWSEKEQGSEREQGSGKEQGRTGGRPRITKGFLVRAAHISWGRGSFFGS
jgi:hypothetical protein